MRQSMDNSQLNNNENISKRNNCIRDIKYHSSSYYCSLLQANSYLRYCLRFSQEFLTLNLDFGIHYL